MAISDFRSAVTKHGGVQRKFRWRVNLAFPAGVVSAEDARDLSVLATTASTPKQVIGEMMVQWGGREFPYPGDRKYEPITFTFINVQDNFGHNALELWSQLINGDDSNTASAPVSDLLVDWTIDLLDQNDGVIKTYTLEDLWPQELGELELDQTSQDEYGTFTLTARYFKSSTNNSR